MLDIINYPIGEMLYVIYDVISKGNPQILSAYALTIIITTILLKVLMMPLTYHQIKSSKKMESIQTELEVLNQKYSNDKNQLNSKVLELYRKNKINPLSTFFPMIFQLPILISFYQVLSNPLKYVFTDMDTFINMDKSFFWIHDLTHQANFVLENGLVNGLSMNYSLPIIGSVIPVLAILVSMTTYINSRTLKSKQNVKDTNIEFQKILLLTMPLIIFIFTLKLPSGLLLYWFVGNLFQYVQQNVMELLPKIKEGLERIYMKSIHELRKRNYFNGGKDVN